MRVGARVIGWAMVGAVLGGTVGCSVADEPRRRLGALPFPGLMTLFATADPAHLGHHRSEGLPPPHEEDRGIIYTARGGFVDVAHVRGTIDWTRYCARHTRAALRRGEKALTLPMKDRTWFHVRLDYPEDWATIRENAATVDELSIRIGQQMAYVMMTLHEVLTWYGYKSTGIIDEAPSAFTPDDVMSHVVGLRVAGAALREAGMDDTRAFDDAVTAALGREMAALGAVPPDRTMAAVEHVRGVWWRDGRPLRRQLDIGLETGRVRPWLAYAGAGNEPGEGDVFELPTLGDVAGRNFEGIYGIEMEVRAWEMGRIRSVVPGHPKWLDPRRDLPAVMEDIRAGLHRMGGPAADRAGR